MICIILSHGNGHCEMINYANHSKSFNYITFLQLWKHLKHFGFLWTQPWIFQFHIQKGIFSVTKQLRTLLHAAG
jgi:hypothetical protein